MTSPAARAGGGRLRETVAWRAARPGAGRGGEAAGRGRGRLDASLGRTEDSPQLPAPGLGPGAGSAFTANSGLHPPARTPAPQRSGGAASILLRPCILITAALIFMSRDSRGPRAVISLARAPPQHPSSAAESWIFFFPPAPSPAPANSWCIADPGCMSVSTSVSGVGAVGKREGPSGETGTHGGGLSVSEGCA